MEHLSWSILAIRASLTSSILDVTPKSLIHSAHPAIKKNSSYKNRQAADKNFARHNSIRQYVLFLLLYYMSSIVGDGWPETIGNDRQMTDIDNEIAPQGKQWQCCTTCQGKGKVLVDVEIPAPTAISVSLSAAGSDGLKR